MSGEFPSDPNPPGIYSPPVNAPVPLPPGAVRSAAAEPAPAPAPPPGLPFERANAATVDPGVPALPVLPPPFAPPPPLAPTPPPAAPAPAFPAPIYTAPAPIEAPAAPPQPSIHTTFVPMEAPAAPPQPPTYAPPASPQPPPAQSPPPTRATAIAGRLKALPLTAKLGAGGVGMVVLGALYLVGGVLAANAEAKSQAGAVQQSGADLTKIDAFLSDVSIRDAEKLDASAFKKALDAYGAKLEATNATLTADQDRIDSTRSNIEFYGWLTPLESKQVHANDATINHASAALAPVVKAVAIFRTEVNFYSIFISAEVHSDSAVAAAKRKDMAAATSEFQLARNDISQAELLAKDGDVAPQFAPVVALYGRFMRDIAGLTSSAQSSDAVGAIQYLLQLDADSSSPVTFDQQAFRAWYSKKIDPIEIDFRKHAHFVPRYVVTRTQLV